MKRSSHFALTVFLAAIALILLSARGSHAHAQPLAKNGTYTDRATGLTMTIKRVVVDTGTVPGVSRLLKNSKLVFLSVTVHNGSKATRQFDSFHFYLKDPHGDCYRTCAYYPAAGGSTKYSPTLFMKTVPPGKTISGWI